MIIYIVHERTYSKAFGGWAENLTAAEIHSATLSLDKADKMARAIAESRLPAHPPGLGATIERHCPDNHDDAGVLISYGVVPKAAAGREAKQYVYVSGVKEDVSPLELLAAQSTDEV